MSEAEKTQGAGVELGPIATRVVYEDERVRVWDQLIEPGQSTGPHHHELPYALVTVEGSNLDVLPVPGYPILHGPESVPDPDLEGASRATYADGKLSVDIASQTAGVLPAGSVEDAINVGDQPYRAILVEFKQGIQD